MLGNMQVTHTICLNGDNLTRQEKAIHNLLVTGANHSTLDVAALKNEYQRKLESTSGFKKMYKCHDCPFSTNWLSNLRNHEKFIHNPSEIKKMYKCQDCTYSTNLPYNLRRHKNAMHNPPVTEYHSTIEIVQGDNEYQKKLELGREIKQIVQELNVPISSMDKEKMDSMELFENHRKVKHGEWRPGL